MLAWENSLKWLLAVGMWTDRYKELWGVCAAARQSADHYLQSHSNEVVSDIIHFYLPMDQDKKPSAKLALARRRGW
jgi:hypothetical protein